MNRISSTLSAWILLAASAAVSEETVWSNPCTSATLTYESRYVLYGYDQGQDLLHADLFCSLPLTDRISAWAGLWYGTQPDGTYNEADFYTGVDFQLSRHFSAGLGYALFNYFEAPYPTSRQAHELSGHLTWQAGPLTLSLRDLYDSEGEGHLARACAEFSRPLTGPLGITVSTEYGYSLDYFSTGQGPNHAQFKLTIPWLMNDTLTLSPFVAHSLALDVLDSFMDDRTWCGIALNASF